VKGGEERQRQRQTERKRERERKEIKNMQKMRRQGIKRSFKGYLWLTFPFVVGEKKLKNPKIEGKKLTTGTKNSDIIEI
jgi:hypothetical protein